MPRHAAAVLLAVLDLLRGEHQASSSSRRSGASAAGPSLGASAAGASGELGRLDLVVLGEEALGARGRDLLPAGSCTAGRLRLGGGRRRCRPRRARPPPARRAARRLARRLADGHRARAISSLGRRLVGEDCRPCRSRPSRRCAERGLAPRPCRSRLSARSVCSGTRPSRYHSVRLISAPPRRPGTARGCPGRRPASRSARRASWPGGTRRGRRAGRRRPGRSARRRVSGCLISSPVLVLDLRVAADLRERSMSLRSRSASAPLRPITMPGRAVWTSTQIWSRVRSISMLEIPARESCVRMYLRIFQSSMRWSVYSVGEPPRLPVGGDPQAEPVRVDLLTH